MAHLVKGTLATLVSGALFYFGTGLHPIWYLTWLAPIPVLLFASSAPGWAAALAAFLAWAAGAANEFVYGYHVVGLPLAVMVVVLVGPSLAFAVAVMIWRFCLRRGAWGEAMLALPSAWAGFEFLNASTSPHGTFGSLAYSQMDCLPVLQLASLTGLWGVSFLVLLAASTAAVLIARRRGWIAGASVLAVFCAVVAFGEWRLQSSLHATGHLDVALIGSDMEQDHWARDDAQALAILGRYAAEVESMKGAQVIVLPEDLGPISPAVSRQAAQILSDAAKHSGAELVAGLRAGRTPPMLNEALVFSPTGTLEAMYEKHHLIPGLEGGIVVGTQISTLSSPSGVKGIEICKDMDFTDLTREYGARGVGLLLVPAFDFDVDRWLHGRMAVMRGVESGFSIARAARHGLLTITDNRGRVLAERPTSKAGFVVVTADVPVAHENTVYDQFGDWFAWLSVALLIASVVSALFRRAAPRAKAPFPPLRSARAVVQ